MDKDLGEYFMDSLEGSYNNDRISRIFSCDKKNDSEGAALHTSARYALQVEILLMLVYYGRSNILVTGVYRV